MLTGFFLRLRCSKKHPTQPQPQQQTFTLTTELNDGVFEGTTGTLGVSGITKRMGLAYQAKLS
jgi:hypothetical protein